MAPASQTKRQTASKVSKASKEKGLSQIGDSIQSLMGSLRKEFSKRVNGPRAKMHTAEFAVTMIKLQQAAFDKALEVVTRVQKRSEKMVKDHVDEASWLPAEGKEIIKEWSRTLSDGRREFQKAVDKSYDLLRSYFERLQKEQKAAAEKPSGARSRAAARKKPAARPVAPQRATTETSPANM